MTKRKKTMNLNETIYGNSYLLGKNVYIDGKHRIENIAFDKYLRNLGLLTDNEPVHNLAVVWGVMEEENYVHQIYNHDTGEIYFDEPTTDEWTDEIDEIVSALLMWGNLEQQIGMNI
jgi:hypothetical protein|tara:strand:+ start:2845 stop:3195 length:351 start_codon:yes stop_codon:yes gene_type:complete